MYSYQCLQNVSYAEITQCLNLAFSDYALPLQLSEEQLQTLFTMNGVDKSLSFGAFFNSRLIGFILNSCSIYNNQKSVFDVGTGVIPEHRGKKVFTDLFAFTEQELLRHKIDMYYLEVLKQNTRAIHAYKKEGFSIVREFSILKSSSIQKNGNFDEVEYIDLDNWDFGKADNCIYVNPSYEHSTNILMLNPRLYGVSYHQTNNQLTSFCIFSKENGHIMQLGYTKADDLIMLLQSLMSRFDNIIVKNIDMEYPEVIEVLNSVGFVELTRQFEMAKSLSRN